MSKWRGDGWRWTSSSNCRCRSSRAGKNSRPTRRRLPCGGDNRLIKPFLAALGFKLTEAQTKCCAKCARDLGGPHPMRRLLQGDVGSGKTAVAACMRADGAGKRLQRRADGADGNSGGAAFPEFHKWFEPLGVKVELQTGSRKTSNIDIERRKSNQHAALITHHFSSAPTRCSHRGFALPNLGLVIIDEQHKFGVAQREQLVRKGRYPHLLVMTATPIPRTLGLTLYGDLDVSVIDELPGGRGRIKTFVRAADKLPKVWEFIREKLAAGRQAYVVYPRVEESGAKGVKAVTKEFENLKALLAPFRVGLLHGRLKGREKEEVMAAFRANTVQVLLATSLIEVGVDVPNATMMLVENAEQFGLAQLHQLRGRIGRGAHESLLHFDFRRENRRGRRTLESAGGDERRFSHCGGGPEIARAGRTAGPGAKRLAEIPFRQSGGRSRFDPAGARAGGESRIGFGLTSEGSGHRLDIPAQSPVQVQLGYSAI